jgi:hypothetical protein
MNIGETTIDYCPVHGIQRFFLGMVSSNGIGIDDEWNDDDWNEGLHCPECYPKHPDNPILQPSAYAEED